MAYSIYMLITFHNAVRLKIGPLSFFSWMFFSENYICFNNYRLMLIHLTALKRREFIYWGNWSNEIIFFIEDLIKWIWKFYTQVYISRRNENYMNRKRNVWNSK